MTARRVAVLLSVVVVGLLASTAQAQFRSINLSPLAGGWSGQITGDISIFDERGRPVDQFRDNDPLVHRFARNGTPIAFFQTQRGQRAFEITHIGQTFDFDNAHGGDTFFVVKALFVRGDRVSYVLDFTETRNNGRRFQKINGSFQRDFDLGRNGVEVRQTIEKRITTRFGFGGFGDTEHRKEVWFGRLGQD